MPSKPMHTYSLGSLTGPVPSARVIRSTIDTLDDESAPTGLFKRNVSFDDGGSADAMFAFVRNITNVAQCWTRKRIEYLHVVPGSISHRDTRLFDHALVRDKPQSKTYKDLVRVLERCATGLGLKWERE